MTTAAHQYHTPLRQALQSGGTILKTWGANVTRRREQLGLTQHQLGIQCGVQGSQISRTERGQGVSTYMMVTLAKELDCTVEHLFPLPQPDDYRQTTAAA